VARLDDVKASWGLCLLVDEVPCIYGRRRSMQLRELAAYMYLKYTSMQVWYTVADKADIHGAVGV
jgi:hypothetical protein